MVDLWRSSLGQLGDRLITRGLTRSITLIWVSVVMSQQIWLSEEVLHIAAHDALNVFFTARPPPRPGKESKVSFWALSSGGEYEEAEDYSAHLLDSLTVESPVTVLKALPPRGGQSHSSSVLAGHLDGSVSLSTFRSLLLSSLLPLPHPSSHPLDYQSPDLEYLRLDKSLSISGSPITALALHPDASSFAVAAEDGQVRIGNVAEMKQTQLLDWVSPTTPTTLAFSTPSTLIVGSERLSLFDLRAPSHPQLHLHSHPSLSHIPISDIAVHSLQPSLIAAANNVGEFMLWDIRQASSDQAAPLTPIHLSQDHSGPVSRIQFVPWRPDTLVSASTDGTVLKWNLERVPSLDLDLFEPGREALASQPLPILDLAFLCGVALLPCADNSLIVLPPEML